MSIEASVIVPTYDQCHALSLCLHSLFSQTMNPENYEIVVADDGSTDATPNLVHDMQATAPCKIKYIWHENMGRSYNRNTGAKAATGRYIIFLDGDMVVKPEFVAAHLAGHTAPNLVVNGPVVNVTSLNPADWPQKIRDYSRAFFATGNVSIEREKFLASGLFDEEFIEYGWEDLELGIRLKKMGLRATKAIQACSYHLQHHASAANIQAILKKEKERGHTAVLFLRKHPTFEVKLMTLITPIYFALDKIFSLADWPEKAKTFELLNEAEQKGNKFLFELLLVLIRNHAYAEGIREALAQNQQ